MQLSASVEAEDDVTAEVSVTLYDNKFGTFVLTGGDALSACVGAQCRTLTRDSLSSEYVAELPYVAETPYTISLSRAAVAGAANSFVALPEWAPAGDNLVDIVAETRCTHLSMDRLFPLPSFRRGLLAENVDSGSIVADVETLLDPGLVILKYSEPASNCEIVIEVIHERLGTVDTGFGSGGIRGVVSRKVTLDYRRRL